MRQLLLASALLAVACGGGGGGGLPVLDVAALDLRAFGAAFLRVHGSEGHGGRGVPVAGGFDCDGDGNNDIAMAAMRADGDTGTVYLIFLDGTATGVRDTAVADTRILRITGVNPQENTGSEIWMDDVTGDGLGDLLIARQNFTPAAGREGAGALTIIAGGAELATLAAAGTPIDLAAPPASVQVVTLIGGGQTARLGIWMRTGDVDGDGTADIVVGEDQANGAAGVHSGAVYVLRGGAHLAATLTADTLSFGTTPLAGQLARVTPPANSGEDHFGATVQVADLDGNGRGEVLAAAALNRAGASLPAANAPLGSAHGFGGTPRGTLYIAWDDNFPAAPWPAGFTFAIDAAPGATTTIQGGGGNDTFGEEILGGRDYDGDGTRDLFLGDIVGDGPLNRADAGISHVIFDAAAVRGLAFTIDNPPGGVRVTTILGATPGAISGDTAAHGDFDGDGETDLVVASPHGTPNGRVDAGTAHVFFGGQGAWPAVIDLANVGAAKLRVVAVLGANGRAGGDNGDTLGYSATAGDIDGDGRDDLIINEMVGNGLAPNTIDVGNVLVVPGPLIAGALD